MDYHAVYKLLKESEGDTMKTSLDGMLLNSIGCERNLQAYYQHGFETLIKDLRELRDRHAAGDHAVVKGFFDIYVIEEGDDGKA